MKQAGTYERLIDRVTQLIYEADPSLIGRTARKECRSARMIMYTTCVIWRRHSNLTIHGYLAIMPFG